MLAGIFYKHWQDDIAGIQPTVSMDGKQLIALLQMLNQEISLTTHTFLIH